MWGSLVPQIISVIMLVFLLTGCSPKNQGTFFSYGTQGSQSSFSDNQESNENKETRIELVINGRTCQIDLVDNPTVTELMMILPDHFTMKDLHHNEKYFDLPASVPSKPERVGKVSKGDVLLYGERTLVIFYEDIPTNYSYTKIGFIQNPQDLAGIGDGDVIVTRE